jgi:hypothetical protein
MKKKIYNFIDDPEKAKKIAKEIVDAFVEEANKENVEYEFDIGAGTGKMADRIPNTSFAFDTNPLTVLHRFKLALFDKDLENISEEEETELIQDTRKFLDEIKNIMNSDFMVPIRETIRRIVLPGSREEDIPLGDIQTYTVDVVDYSSVPDPARYLLRIGKKPDTDVDTEQIVQYVHACQEKSGISVEEVYESEKDTELFENIVSLDRGKKYIYDVTVIFFVDYSLAKMPSR